MWDAQKAREDVPDPLRIIGTLLLQLIFGIYGLCFSTWAVLETARYGDQPTWLAFMILVAIGDAVLQIYAGILILRAKRTKTGSNRLLVLLFVQAAATITTLCIVLKPWWDVFGSD